MEEVNFYPESVYYIYRNRSCKNCDLRETCHALKKDWSSKWLDMGKAGCFTYEGKYKNEKKFKKQILK